MYLRAKKKEPCFVRSKLNNDNVGLLKNRFTYRGLMDDYLKMDAGELAMCESIRYQGKIQNDFFENWGDLYLLNGIVIKGEWKNGSLIKGNIFFEEIDEIDSIFIDTKNNNHIYNITYGKKTEEIEDGKIIEFDEKDKKYSLIFRISKFKGLKIDITVEIPKKTLSKGIYLLKFQINSNLKFKKEIVIENSILSFELFANYKFGYTFEDIQNGINFIDKIIVYSNGKVFGGNTRINASEEIELNKKKVTKLMKMPGYFIDLDDIFNKETNFDFYQKFPLSNLNLIKNIKPNSKKNKSEFPDFFKNFLENVLEAKKVNYLKILLESLFSDKEIKIEWKSFDVTYFDRLTKFVGKKFNYSERLSKGFVEKRKIEPFQWNDKFLERFKL